MNGQNPASQTTWCLWGLWFRWKIPEIKKNMILDPYAPVSFTTGVTWVKLQSFALSDLLGWSNFHGAFEEVTICDVCSKGLLCLNQMNLIGFLGSVFPIPTGI